MRTMYIPAVAVALASAISIAPAQAATTVNFDQGTTTGTYASQGLVINGFTILSNTFGGAVNTPSAPNYANADATGSTLSFIDPTTGLTTTSNGFGLTVIGLNSGGGFYNGATLSFFGSAGNLLGTQTFAPVGPSEDRDAISYSNSFAGIASINFALIQNPSGPGLFGIDDVTFTPNAVAAVPEATTWAMMLAGFGMIGFAVRRRSSVKTTVRFA